MTAIDIQRRLMVEKYRRSFVLPNYEPKQWFECDVFELTEAGFFREYEIKLSRADFKADARKCRTNYEPSGRADGSLYESRHENKHASLAARATHGPTRFWYVCPSDLLTVEEMPEWAGLIYARPLPNHRPPWNVLFNEIKPAPQLHREKASEKVKAHAESVCYWRMHGLFINGRLSTEATLPEISLPEPEEARP